MFERKVPRFGENRLKQEIEMALVTANAALPMQATRPNHLVLVQDQTFRVQKQPIRLTRRGRRVVALLAIIPIALTFLLIGMRGAVATDGTVQSETQSVVVKPGQSLWDVAVAISPNTDPRETIWLIQQLNTMETSDVLAGQALVVPKFN
jgi:hypothetical protein